MKNLLRSKLGIVFASFYLLLIAVGIQESCGSKPEPMDAFGFLILTAPWSFFLLIFLDKVGLINDTNGDSFLPLLVAFGAAVNILILLLFGHGLTKLFNYLDKVTNRPQ